MRVGWVYPQYNRELIDPSTYISPLFDGMIWYAWHVFSWFFSSTFWQRCWLLITNPQREIRRNISPQNGLDYLQQTFDKIFQWQNFEEGGESRNPTLSWYPQKRLAASKSHMPIHSTSTLEAAQMPEWNLLSTGPNFFVDKRLTPPEFFRSPWKMGGWTTFQLGR